MDYVDVEAEKTCAGIGRDVDRLLGFHDRQGPADCVRRIMHQASTAQHACRLSTSTGGVNASCGTAKVTLARCARGA